MEQLNICNDFYEIISGSSSAYSKAYTEAKQIADDNEKSLNQIKNFITSIENVASKKNVKDERISSSKGKITEFKGYEDIKNALDFLKKNLGNVNNVKDLDSIKSSLEKNQNLYADGYSKNIRLIILEYESALYSLVTGLSYIIANNIDVVTNGFTLKITKKRANDAGVINKINSDLAKQLADNTHVEYLEVLLKGKEYVGVNTDIKESTFIESAVSDALDLFDAITTNIAKIGRFGKRTLVGIKNSIFGIIPLIRSIIYLRYKKKADTIQSLEQQMDFIQKNIDQLKNIKNMDPVKKTAIIKKQQAIVEAYKKKAEKLRAELVETEKETASEISKNNSSIKAGTVKPASPKDDEDDDDLVLESSIGFEERGFGPRIGREIHEVTPPEQIKKDDNKNDDEDGFKNIKPESDITFQQAQDFWDDLFGNMLNEEKESTDLKESLNNIKKSMSEKEFVEFTKVKMNEVSAFSLDGSQQ